VSSLLTILQHNETYLVPYKLKTEEE